jgi:hypothetical protein
VGPPSSILKRAMVDQHDPEHRTIPGSNRYLCNAYMIKYPTMNYKRSAELSSPLSLEAGDFHWHVIMRYRTQASFSVPVAD